MAAIGEENIYFEMESKAEGHSSDAYEDVVGSSGYTYPVTTQGAVNKRQTLTEAVNALQADNAKVRRMVFVIGVVVVANFMIAVATLTLVVTTMISENVSPASKNGAAVQKLESNETSTGI